MILTNARILTFDAANRVLDSGSVEVLEDGAIGSVRGGRALDTHAVDLHGRLLMPALINCHTHLYSTLARGMHVPGPPPADFPAILKKLWWRLDRALNEEDVYYSALTGLIDSARCGVGTVIDHHASPNACAGSLDSVERAFHEVGLRGATCYETSDRWGRRGALAGIRENVRFLERVRPGARVGGMFGLHAAFTLGDRTLAECVEANQSLGAGFHIHVAEDACDRAAVRRLSEAGVLDEKSLAAHCIHLTAAERTLLASRRVNVVHNPQSNCNNAVGIANLPALFRRGIRVGLGSDGYSPRMFDEFKVATQLQKVRAGDARVGGAEAYAALFRGNRDIVKQIWGTEIGRIAPGARADLLLVDYLPPTPIDSSNLFGHLLFGVSNAPVDSLMVDGRWVVRDGHCVNLDERKIAEKATACAKALWDRFSRSFT
jgi:putative selenium metabolism protein SsnA